ncbi:uncharacterized protein cfap97d2 [Mugil cephalus]|uniref:uncharacterized protein cfap97d2 n=1 Tax=Mugil cephalus TaxID=48193 RepID=UPI001FB71399|nr:uncharacterized protein cfap97d2 [Mugil cephalus]
MKNLAYQPVFPIGNKHLQPKWDKASYDLHRRKVKSAKATINMAPPKTYSHLTLNLKKQKLEEEWKMKIQRENHMLSEKISHIMRTTGGVESRNYYDRKSLANEKRQLELLRITKENQMILFRLSRCRPHYNVWAWHEDWLKTLKMMDSIARIPRRRANLQKGQENPCKKSSDCNKEKKMSTNATTHAPASNKSNDKGDSEEKKRETNGNEDAGMEKVTKHDLNPDVVEKSIDLDTDENPDPAAKSSTPSTTHTPTTHKQETTSTEEV